MDQSQTASMDQRGPDSHRDWSQHASTWNQSQTACHRDNSMSLSPGDQRQSGSPCDQSQSASPGAKMLLVGTRDSLHIVVCHPPLRIVGTRANRPSLMRQTQGKLQGHLNIWWWRWQWHHYELSWCKHAANLARFKWSLEEVFQLQFLDDHSARHY